MSVPNRPRPWRAAWLLALLGVLALVLAACADDEPAADEDDDVAEEPEPDDEPDEEPDDEPDEEEAPEEEDEAPDLDAEVTILANWLPQASQGGYWHAAAAGLAEDDGVTIEMLSGGPGIATVTNVAIDEADYGMTASDNILTARAEGVPVVAVWGGFEVSPQCFITHPEAGVEDFDDLDGMTVSVSPAGTFWPVIQERYGISAGEEIPPADFGTFMENPDMARQCFADSEPFTAEQEGFDYDLLMIHDSGYQTYAQMLFTTEDRIREHPEEVRAVVAAAEQGWIEFLEQGVDSAGMQLIFEENPDYTEEQGAFSVDMIRDEFIGDPPGEMTDERWEAVYEDLLDAELVEVDIPWQDAFTTEFME